MGLFRTAASNYEAPDLPAGSYVVTCTGVGPTRIPDPASPTGDKALIEWKFNVHGPSGVAEMNRLTGLAASPKSKNWEFAVALLGPEKVRVDMDFNPIDFIGHSALATLGVSEKGKFGILSLAPLPMGMTAPGNGHQAAAPAPVQQPAFTQAAPVQAAPQTVRAAVGSDDDDDLPF